MMSQEGSPESVVDAFLSTDLGKVTKCVTCNLPNAQEINRALTRFHEARLGGETTHTWKDFFRHVMVPQFNYPASTYTMRRHAKECLGLT